MNFKQHYKESLEQFRVSAIEEIKNRSKEITQAVNRVIKEPFKVKVIGSVINKDKFTEHSDVDLGVYINSKDYPGGVIEELSERVQEEFKKIPFDFGILNVVVVNILEENI